MRCAAKRYTGMPEASLTPSGRWARIGALLDPMRVVGALRTTRRSVERIPDLIEAVLVLPALSHQLEAIRFSTVTLPEMHAEIQRMRDNTAALPQIEETLAHVALQLERVDRNTAGVQNLADVMIPLQGAAVRVGRLSDRFGRHAAT